MKFNRFLCSERRFLKRYIKRGGKSLKCLASKVFVQFHAAADKPSGKRKRCPDGEHKDEDGQCRPVT